MGLFGRHRKEDTEYRKSGSASTAAAAPSEGAAGQKMAAKATDDAEKEVGAEFTGGAAKQEAAAEHGSEQSAEKEKVSGERGQAGKNPEGGTAESSKERAQDRKAGNASSENGSSTASSENGSAGEDSSGHGGEDEDAAEDPLVRMQERADQTAGGIDRAQTTETSVIGPKHTKEIRKMSRLELIDVIYALAIKNRDLKKENADLRTEAETRSVKLAKAGSIADASSM